VTGDREADMPTRGLASDNQSGAHPEVLEAIAAANAGHVPAYGDDEYTARAVEVLRDHLGQDAEVFFVFGGTGANVSGLSAVLASWQAVICADTAHIACDEAGAPERFTGAKLLTVSTPDGKLTPELAGRVLTGIGVEHHSQPRVLSITQVSEMGTVYTAAEVRALAGFAHGNGLLLHMDGARLANAAVALDLPFSAFTTDAGVDVLSFGGTKNGMLYGEAVCFLGSQAAERARDFKYVRKQAAQLPSKCRFIAAQFAAMYEGDLWRRCAGNANDMAMRLADGVASITAVQVTQPVQANELFATLPAEAIPHLQEQCPFYVWTEHPSEVRWVTSWDTTPEDIDAFAQALKRTLGE
jgi:threonine aldolase